MSEHDRPVTTRTSGPSVPRLAENFILEAYLKLIASARSELVIANAYFVPTPLMRAALRDAVSRCVAVTLVTNSPGTNDLPEISLVGRGHYRELLGFNELARAAGCTGPGLRVWEWTGMPPDAGAPRYGTMHSKFAVVDRRLALVGSYNLDPRRARLNSETAIVVEEGGVAATLARSVLEQDLRYSREVMPQDAAAYEHPRGAVTRMRLELARLFEAEL